MYQSKFIDCSIMVIGKKMFLNNLNEHIISANHDLNKHKSTLPQKKQDSSDTNPRFQISVNIFRLTFVCYLMEN